MNRTGSWWRVRVVAVLVAVVLAAAACGDDGGGGATEGAADDAPVQGGTLVYGANQEVSGWNTAQLKGSVSGEERGQFIYDSLLLIGPDGGLAPNMATEVASKDGITWTLKLRPGLKFTDGTPLDAAAVVWNIEWTKDPKNGSSLTSLVSNITSSRAVDPTTAEFVLKSPNGAFAETFARLPGQMMSPTAFQKDPQGFTTKPVGAGPFMLESWVRDSKAVLVRNPGYFDAPRPYLDKIEIRVLLDDVTRGQSLMSGEVDLVVAAPSISAAVKGDKGKVTFPLTGFGWQFLAPNQDRAPFNDLRIRQAIQMAIDPDLVNASLMQGTLTPPIMPCPPFKPGDAECNESIWPRYDLAKAKALVKAYTDEKGPLGTYTMVLNQDKRDVAELAQQILGEIGIRIRLETLPVAEYLTRYTSGDCDICSNENVPRIGPQEGLYLNFHSTQRHAQRGPVDPELDKALADAKEALDRDTKVAAGKKVLDILSKKAVITYLNPTLRGMTGKSSVHLGDELSAGGLVAQNIWKTT